MDELKALLKTAQENFEASQAKVKTLETEITAQKARGEKTDAEILADRESQKELMTELKNEIADLEAKIKTSGKPVDETIAPETLKKAVQHAVGKFIKARKENIKTPEQFKNFIETEVKAALNLTTTAQGLESIDQVLSREIIERARETYPVIGEVGVRNMPRSLREQVLISYPSIAAGIENVAGTAIAETDVQRYAEVVNQVCKLTAKPRITDEAMVGGDLDLYGHLLTLLDDEMGRYIALQILFGDGATKNMRGILSSNRLDLTPTTGESFKPTLGAGARDPDFYPAIGTGVSAGLPATDVAKVDYLIDIETQLPSKYLQGAKYHMNRRTLAMFRKVRDADERPIFSQGFMGEAMSLNGYPVVIDDDMPDVGAANAPFLIFGKLSEAFYVSPGDIDYMLPDPYSVDGCTVFKTHKELFEIVGKNDAIIIGAATTASA